MNIAVTVKDFSLPLGPFIITLLYFDILVFNSSNLEVKNTVLVQIFKGRIFHLCHKFSIFVVLFSRITGFQHNTISMLCIINCKFLRT